MPITKHIRCRFNFRFGLGHGTLSIAPLNVACQLNDEPDATLDSADQLDKLALMSRYLVVT